MIEQWINVALGWVGSLTPQITFIVFFISLIGEAFVISVPFVFELIFVGAGIQLSAGVLPITDVLILALASQLGRQAGALILFALSRKSTTLFWKLIARRFPEKNSIANTPLKFLRHLDAISPFGVALGRLLWLRIPLTLILGAKRKLKTLILGIAISSTIYEGVYIGLGAIVGNTVDLESPWLIAGFVGSLGVVYLITFLIRLLINKMKKRQKTKKAENTSIEES